MPHDGTVTDSTATTDQTLVGIESIRQAADEIKGIAVRTPLLASPWPDLWLKPENLQPMGAFKIRGATTAIARLSPEQQARGILAHSSGNHAQAVAYAARRLGLDAYIVIPDNAPARKVEATRGYGATVELVPLTERFTRPAELQRETGKPMVPPFDSMDVIAGQGTVGLEIAEDMPDVDVVLVPVSGGGLISGVAAAIAALVRTPRSSVSSRSWPVMPPSRSAPGSARSGRRTTPPARWPTACGRSASARSRGGTSRPTCTTS